MRLIDIMRISSRMLRSNLLRSLLTILGIGVAVSLIVILIGLGYGLQTVTIGSIVSSKSLYSVEVRQGNESNSVALDQKTVTELEQQPEAATVTPVIITASQIEYNGKLAAAAVSAAKSTIVDMEGVTLSHGRLFNDAAAEVIISPLVAQLLDVAPEELIGKQIKLTYDNPNNGTESLTLPTLTVVGISNNDSSNIYVPYKLIDPVGNAHITLAKATAKTREGVLVLKKFAEDRGYAVETLVDTLDQARKVFNWVTIGLSFLGAIALFVASIGMFNTLTIALLERTREIGIMKSIGVTNLSIRQIFLTEAGLIGLFSGLAGVGIGLAIAQALSFGVGQLAHFYKGTSVQLFQYPTGFLLIMVLFPVILAVVTGFYPSNRAANLNPLQALRYE